ncbi:hypothetical protein PLICRDRAFT_56936 [Plicaturopsis crispa FD-325 SS-3]|nr:hypothetical protein PLICRDRAFT_56936 [Plicaturopsis crispa FD-325 SS-3]
MASEQTISPLIPDDYPTELIILILQFAAASSKDFCDTLCLVASWTRELAWPFLVSTVVLQQESSLNGFHRLIMRDPRRALLVRNIWLHVSLWDSKDGVAPNSQICRIGSILMHCQNATRIAFSAAFVLRGLRGLQPEEWEHLAGPRDVELTIVGQTYIQDFYLHSDMLKGATQNPVFSVMTRLDLTHAGTGVPLQLSELADACPQLTHLKVRFEYPEDDGWVSEMAQADCAVYDMLDDDSSSLKFVALAMDLAETTKADFLAWYLPIQSRDDRLCVTSPISTPHSDWRCAAGGGEDVWDRARRDTLTLVKSMERPQHSLV